jgi:hypothetical protein
MNKQEKMRLHDRLGSLANSIEDELEYRAFGASDELDFEMSSARLVGYNAEVARLEKLL